MEFSIYHIFFSYNVEEILQCKNWELRRYCKYIKKNTAMFTLFGGKYLFVHIDFPFVYNDSPIFSLLNHLRL